MKKIVLILGIMLFTASAVYAAALNEGFEGTFPPTDWTNTTISGHAWKLSTSEAHTGSNSAEFEGTDYEGYNSDLITPRLDLTAGGSDELTFWIQNEDWDGDQNVCEVYISTDGGSTWALLATYDTDIPAFEEKTLDLETAITQTDNAYIKFWGEDNYGHGVFIDDVLGPELYVPTTPIFSVDPALKDFGTVNVDESSAAQTFTVTNTGSSTLTINPAISITGTNSDQFDLTDPNVGNYPVELTAGQSMTVDVTFKPTSVGAKTANLHIVDSIAKTEHDVALSGDGYDPYITSYPYTQNFDSVTPPDLPLGWSKLDDTGSISTKVETIANDAHSEPNSVMLNNFFETTDNLILISPPTELSTADTRVKFWGKGPTVCTGHQVNVGTMSDKSDAATFSSIEIVEFTPTYTQYTVEVTDVGKGDAYIAFKHGMTETFQSIFIDDFTWEEIPTGPVCAIDPTSKAFGTVNVGGSSAAQTFTISNDGVGILTLTGVSITGTDLGQFTLTDENSYTHDLTPGQSITVDVAFSPTSVGSKSANLSIESNAKVTHTAALTGWGPNFGGGCAAQGGYYFANSTSGASGAPSQPSYGWIDISTTGIDVSGTVSSDNSVGGPYDIGFTFNYFGVDYTQFWICADGYIDLVEETVSNYSNVPIPTAADPNGMIALLWDDMNPGDTNVTEYHLYYGTTGGNMVITYEKMPEYGADENGWFTAQAILYPSGNIKLQYNDVGSSFNLTGCTVGIENADGTLGVGYLFDSTGGEIYSGAKEGEIAVMFGKDEGTLPVVLSAFTAQFLNNVPTIYWSSESENDNLGWFVYRNTEDDFTTAEKISEFIEGHGTTTQQHLYLHEDNIQNPQAGDTFYYWLESIDYSGQINHYDKVAVLTIPDHDDPGSGLIPEPVRYGLFQNNPNPFIESTKISFNLPETAKVVLNIYNLKGQLVKSLYSGVALSKTLDWNGKDGNGKTLTPGVYFYNLIVNGKTEEIKKLILMR